MLIKLKALAKRSRTLVWIVRFSRAFKRRGMARLKLLVKSTLMHTPRLRSRLLSLRRSMYRDSRFEQWIATLERIPTASYYAEALSCIAQGPRISVIVPVYNVKAAYLNACVESVLAQYYDNWELCLCDDASTDLHVKPLLRSFARRDDRIKAIFREKNGHIAAATNSALAIATGEYVAFLDNDDVITPNALAEMVLAIDKEPEADVLYSDVDNIDASGRRRLIPHFKPDWSPDTLMSCMYLIHLLVMRRSLVAEVGGFREGFDGSQDYDLALRVTEKARKIIHIPKILYHWRLIPTSTTARGMEAKPYAIDAAIRAKQEALARRGLEGRIVYDRRIEQSRVHYSIKGIPLVSIIIPTRNHLEDVSRCVSSIIEKSVYRRFEILLVDNGSDEPKAVEGFAMLAETHTIRVIREECPFNFSLLCNRGAREARGEYLLFLNNDTEVLSPEWLERMLALAQLGHVGAVGARLLYPNGTIQHSGIVNYEVGPGHPFVGDPIELLNYYRSTMDGNWLCVTAACMLVSKDKFMAAGGFDEELAVAYNDVALCFALHRKGYYNAVAQESVLHHYESKSRGLDAEDEDSRARQLAELEILYRKFPEYKGRDPFYNPNLIQNRGDFSVRCP
jgi:O-antigen biosynthesis protein